MSGPVRRTSLRYRIAGVMLAASLAFGIAVVAITWVETEHMLERHTRAGTAASLQAASRSVADRVLVQDALALREATAELLAANSQWLAVTVTDATGGIIASAPLDLPDRLLADLPRGADDQVANGGDLVVRLPLISPDVGHLTAIVSGRQNALETRATVRRLALAVAILTVTGIGTAVLLAHWLTRDLVRLSELVERIGEGEFGETVPVPEPDDEVAMLARAINRTSRSLEEAQARLATQQTQLVNVEKLAAVGTIAAGIVHEIANPVAGAANCMRRLRRPDLSPERRESYVEASIDGLERAGKVLQDLLVYARGAPPSAQLSTDELDLRESLEQVRSMIAVSSQVPVRLQDGPDATVTWPWGRVEQILANLLLNACQAAITEVALCWRLEGDDVVLEITDDGAGIPEENRERVFEPFFTTREVGEGTGLGLAVSASIAATLGGRIELLPRGGDTSGTVARLRLPRVCTLEGAA